MTDQQPSSREEQIRRTIAEINHCTDTGDYAGWVSLFAEEGAFHMFGQSVVGREALRAFINADQPEHLRGLHLTTDSLIVFEAKDRARVRSSFLFVASGEEAGVAVAAGWYHDILVPRGDRWLFLEREAELFGPIASQAWGRKGFEDPGKTPWFAVTRATPPERREAAPFALVGASPEG
jgi:hypothetical protein